MARFTAGILCVLLASAPVTAAVAAERFAGPAPDAATLLAIARSLPPGGGVIATSTPGGATLPGLGGGAQGGGGAGTPQALANPGGAAGGPPADIAPLPATISSRFRPNEVLVVLQAGATIETAQGIAQTFNLQLETFSPSRLLRTPVARFRIPDGRAVPAVVAAMAGDARVRARQPNFLFGLTAGEVTGGGLPQYALDVMKVSAARDLAGGRASPLISVIDTGIDEGHPDLAGNVRDRFDALGDGQWDAGPHGTGIAGIIGAHGQLQGILPGARLLSVRAFAALEGAAAETTSETLRRGLDWSAEQGADIVNMSLAGPEDPIVDAAVSAAIAEGIIVVAAAGNEGPGAPPAHPAAVKGVVAVTATDDKDGRFSGANEGSYISVSAPGVDILSAIPGGDYNLVTGTSQAAAHATGVIALMRALSPGLQPAAALEALEKGAKDLGDPGMDASYGAGRIDAEAALRALSNVVLVKQ